MNSFIGWIGGKRALRNEILQRMPSGIGRYIEVFGGAGWVLFGREPSSKVMEVFNDYDAELVNIYRCIRKEDRQKTVVQTPHPVEVIEKSLATSSLIACILHYEYEVCKRHPALPYGAGVCAQRPCHLPRQHGELDDLFHGALFQPHV